MIQEIKAGQACKWIGPDQRTREVSEQTVYVAFDPTDGMVYVQDEVGYWIRIPAGELVPLEEGQHEST